jgi:glyoxylase-like metal-dependent hydrolase (beta-lactamase superfamily II)
VLTENTTPLTGIFEMARDDLFERLWNGTAQMEEWTAAVSEGAITHVAENIITVHTTYFCGSVTAIRTRAGLVLIDTAKPETASQTLAVVRSWDDSPIHTVIYTHGHIDHTSGIKVIDEEADARGRSRPRIIAHRNVQRRMERYEASHGFNSIVQGQQFNKPDYVYPPDRPEAPRRDLRRYSVPDDRRRTVRTLPRQR